MAFSTPDKGPHNKPLRQIITGRYEIQHWQNCKIANRAENQPDAVRPVLGRPPKQEACLSIIDLDITRPPPEPYTRATEC